MKLYAQHGFQPGKRISQALADQLIDGVIYSAKDIDPAKLAEVLGAQASLSDRFFDPQYYACLTAAQPGARLGWLLGDEGYPYFRARRRADLEREANVREDLEACLAFQSGLKLAGLIAPNIVIRRSFDSVEGSIAKAFIRNTAAMAQAIAPRKAVYATLAISAAVLGDRIELQNFLQEITEIETPPAGFYLLLERPDQAIPPCLTEQDVLSRWMLINHTLKVNGFKLINGYTDGIAPYIGAVGSDAVASGWFNTLKAFSLKKFEPIDEQFARRAVARYTSKALLKSIRSTELHDLRGQFPEVLNGLPTDTYYDADEGSEPAEAAYEALQNWDAIRAMSDGCAAGEVGASLNACHQALDDAEDLYGRITDRGFTLRDRSSNAHIEAIRYELNAFAELAEI
ncbi:MAG: hypothetical protein WC378_04615 [Opitutaceae bacterium]|jgi:hypothetical protein